MKTASQLQTARPADRRAMLASAVTEPCRIPVPAPIPVPRKPRGVRFALSALALALVATAFGQSAARAASPFAYAADGRLVDVQVQVEGRTAPLYFAEGRFDRRYFQAFRGRNYSLVVRNNSGRRVGVLIAVDGLNVVNGQRSSLANDEAMYVLDPYEQATIRGWRTSLDDVRRFVFVDEERSYAERTGQANGDLGWIRVLAFREQLPWRDLRGQIRSDEDGLRRENERLPFGYGGSPESQAPGRDAPQAKAAPAPTQGFEENRAPAESKLEAERSRDESNPGTGWGQRSHDPVRQTRFVAEGFATDHLILRYEYASGLRALGIIPAWRGDRLRERERGELGFAQPPRW